MKKQNLESELEERLNEEVESLKIQVKLLESELEISRMRAESTDEELRQLKATLRLSAKMTEMDASTSHEEAKEIPKPPPPPPPPMPNLLNSTQTNSTFRSRSNSQTLNDAINDAQQKLQQTSESKKAKQATGRNENSYSHRPVFCFPSSLVCKQKMGKSNPFSVGKFR
jgi:type IV secretory pathway VirB10-like protein